jgi:serine/threonine protein kinase
MSLEGRTIGKYRVLDPLGRGGMARVYRAYHPQLDRYVAIKVLRADLVDDDEFLARFHREAQAVASLRHPNIVQVHDFDIFDNTYYMVMELLEGATLKTCMNEYRARDEHLPYSETVRILVDVLDGLDYAHQEGMIHRDIKPGNIVLTRRGRAVLTDFGIAQIVGGTRYTVTGALMGTLNYMAPEQGLKGECDARCDIYSSGIVLYEMLTQSVPFDADTPLAILMRHLNDPLPLPRSIDPEIPEPLERIVLKALSKAPDGRYASAREMADALFAAAETGHIEVPDKVSLPRSFNTPHAPSEAVAVLSGTERAGIADIKFAADDTDTHLRTTLPEPIAVGSEAPAAAPAQPTGFDKSVFERTAETIGRAVVKMGSHLVDALPLVSQLLERHIRGRPARAILTALGVLALYNLSAVWLGGLTRWWGLLTTGWPIQLLVISLGLALLMYTLPTIWLLIPVGIILGHGILFTYCQLIGSWDHWAFLWPLEPILTGGTVYLTIWLGRHRSASGQLAASLGCALGAISVVWIVIAILLTVVVGIVRSFIG